MKYWNNICKLQKKQTEKGMSKYGQILEENTGMNIIERLTYLEEELIDGLMYIEHIKAHFVDMEDDLKLKEACTERRETSNEL